MKRLIYGLASAAFLAALAVPAGAQRVSSLSAEVREFVAVDAPIVALTGVRVIDGTGAPPRNDQTILIRNQLIVSIGPSARVAVPHEVRRGAGPHVHVLAPAQHDLEDGRERLRCHVHRDERGRSG